MTDLSSNETHSTDQLEACLRLLHVVESLEIVSNGLMKECEGEILEHKVKRGVIVLHHNIKSVVKRSSVIYRALDTI